MCNLSQEWWDAKLLARGYPFWLSYFPKILLACAITLMDEAYYKVALWLNDCGKDANFNKLVSLCSLPY